MTSETAGQKAARLLAEGRVQIIRAADVGITARVRGDGGIYDIAWDRDRFVGWHCSCAAYARCSHLVAVQWVTVRSPHAPEAA